jgi:hypothetical protein
LDVQAIPAIAVQDEMISDDVILKSATHTAT